MSAATPPDELHALAAAYAVDTDYHDWQGVARAVGDDTLRAVLAAFGVDASTPETCRAALVAVERAGAARVLPPCAVVRAGRASDLPSPATATEPRVELEDGSVRQLELAAAGLRIPAGLPTGYHRLVVVAGDAEHSCPLIVTPDRAPLPRSLRAPVWGLAAQLYSVRSAGSWGIGDLADLKTLATWSARVHAADFVLVNPLHAAEVVPPMTASPYLPTTRRFANPIYLRVESIAEYGLLPPGVRAEVDRLGLELRRQDDGELIDRDPAWAAKEQALQVVFAAGRTEDRETAFRDFCAREGTELDGFATWCVLTELHGPSWRSWPPALRDPAARATAEVARDHGSRFDFHRWLQWQLDEQLADAQAAARAAGMSLGLINDVAVGVSPDGADAWAWQDVLATEVTVGAPPDAYSQRGQNWNQPPWRPDRLAELGYVPLRELYRAALRHCGGLRVDHIIGLFRLWWIPDGMTADRGTYVRYDHEALIGILALEAERAGALIIGEDLGNVEPSAHAYLRERGLFGTSILWFETGAAGPLPPQRWRVYCLASVTTHDLPPTTGYLAGDHIELRDRLGLLTRPVDEELAAARTETAVWLDALRRQGLLPEGGQPTADHIVLALHAFLTRTPALLRCVALTDAVGERRTQNQPGTSAEDYPNWRIPLGGPDGQAMPLETVLADQRTAAVLRAVRG